MIRFIVIFLTFILLASFNYAQVKLIDIPNVRSEDDIKMERLSNGSYIVSYRVKAKDTLAIYDENFVLLKKIEVVTTPGYAGNFIFTSDKDLVCLCFPENDAADETDYK